MNIDDTSFFTVDDDGLFVGNDAARGPWSADACHAGPVTGLIARAFEQAVADRQLVRITVNFQRPVTMHGFRIETEVTREGRAVSTTSAILRGTDGTTCATATSLHLVTARYDGLPTQDVPAPVLAEATPGKFAIDAARHGRSYFRDWLEVAYPPGQTDAPGPTTVWMRAPPLLPDEEPSPFQSVCPLADCGNGLSRNAEITEASFVNPDLTVILHRLPRSEWLASSAISFWEPTGIGLATATLFDEHGAIGVASQSLLVRPV